MAVEEMGGMRHTIVQLLERHDELQKMLADPETQADRERYGKLVREYRELEDVVEVARQHQRVSEKIEQDRTLLTSPDKDLSELAEEEIEQLQEHLEELEERLKLILVPAHPRDKGNALMEIRAGTGGHEASLFVADLYRMYIRYGEQRGWRQEVMSSSPTEVGGFKEIIFSLEGSGAFGHLRFESGVHRVQRVPETEASGRIHTSAASVVVLPEPEEVEVQIDPKDLRIDVFRSSGPGGQSVNTTDSAVRITHVPSGIVATCQDEKSQHKNKAKALKVLRARLMDRAHKKQEEDMARTRRSQVGSGDRSAKIRTYNFPQNRVTDHRVNLTLYRLDQVLDGDLNELVEVLQAADKRRRLEEADLEGARKVQ
jgi:peptide chain release factor 1